MEEFGKPKFNDISPDKNKEARKFPKGWKTRSGICAELQIKESEAKDIIERLENNNEQYIYKYPDEIGRMYTRYSREFISLIQKEVSVPKDWVTSSVISMYSGFSSGAIEKITKKYAATNPEGVGEFKNEDHAYSPKVTAMIYEELANRVVPEGWEKNESVAEKLSCYLDTIKKIAEKYIQIDPEYSGEYYQQDGRKKIVGKYYSPELIKIIINEIEVTPIALEGWKTAHDVFRELRLELPEVMKIVEPYRQTNSEYFKEYKEKYSERWAISEYYSPELMQIIRTAQTEMVKEMMKNWAQEDWKTNGELAKDLGVHFETVQKRANKYRESHPEYFKKSRDKEGKNKILEYYTLELIKIITNEINEFKEQEDKKIRETPYAPENWFTNEDLSEKTGIPLDDIKKITAKYRKDFPDDIGNFKDKE